MYEVNSFDVVGLVAGMFGFVFAILAITYVVNSFILMRLFNKAGVEGWKAWIPIYNTWVMFTLCGLPGWLVLLSFVPLVNFVAVIAMFIMRYRLPLCYEKTQVWGVLNIFFPLIVMIILAFDYSEYCGWEGR